RKESRCAAVLRSRAHSRRAVADGEFERLRSVPDHHRRVAVQQPATGAYEAAAWKVASMHRTVTARRQQAVRHGDVLNRLRLQQKPRVAISTQGSFTPAAAKSV